MRLYVYKNRLKRHYKQFKTEYHTNMLKFFSGLAGLWFGYNILFTGKFVENTFFIFVSIVFTVAFCIFVLSIYDFKLLIKRAIK